MRIQPRACQRVFAKHVSDKDLCPENIKIPCNKNQDSKPNFWNGQKRDIIPKNLISKSCKLETALMSINRGMDKQVVTYSDGWILLGNGSLLVICVTVRTQDNIYCNFTFMWSPRTGRTNPSWKIPEHRAPLGGRPKKRAW